MIRACARGFAGAQTEDDCSGYGGFRTDRDHAVVSILAFLLLPSPAGNAWDNSDGDRKWR